MKLFTTLSKNLKLLFRNKESAYTIVFGPILIILLVSFAFMGSTDEYTVSVGTYAPVHTELSTDTVDTLNRNGYLVSVYPTNTSCVESVRTGDTHACLVFSEEEAGNGTVPITFYLDLSRINIVYQIIDDLSAEMDIQADEIRRGLASDTLTRIQTASILLGEGLDGTPEIIALLEDAEQQLEEVQDVIGTIPSEVDQNRTNLLLLRGYQQGLALNTKNVATLADERLDESAALLRELEKECENCSDGMEERVENLREAIRETQDEMALISEELTDNQISEATLLIQYALDDLEKAEETVRNTTRASSTIAGTLTTSYEDIADSRRDLQQILGRLSYTKEFLDGERTDAETLAAPIATSVVSITVADDQLSFAYPYLLILVIMFIGILLSSTLVVTDKTSRARFRSFTTPTSDGYHVALGFITAFLILLVEVAVILLVSGLFVAQPLLLNLWPTMLIIVVAIILFTFLGMIIGYLSRTQEAAMISSISVASILLFVSNLVLPMEGMTRIVQSLAIVNPYIVLSELLKKSMLYGVSMAQVSRDLLVLLSSAVVLLILTILVQRHVKRRYFKQEEPLLPMRTHIPKPLLLGEMYVHDVVELMDALDRMTRQEFETLMAKGNIISLWVEKELRIKRLARQLRTKNKERMILKLDRYLKWHAKRIKR